MKFIVQTKDGVKGVLANVSYDRKTGEFVAYAEDGVRNVMLSNAILKSISSHVAEIEGLKRSGDKFKLVKVWLRNAGSEQ